MPNASSTTFRFTGAASGTWRVLRADALRGAALAASPFVAVERADTAAPVPSAAWALYGFVSNVRYATRNESERLKAVQEGLARPQATRAALIPLRKNAAWWDLPQDDRRAIFEETSHHTQIGLGYLPAVARRLYHARDLGEPFDFLTWFEFAPEHEAAFDDLVARLRATAEWNYVDREIDIRLERTDD